MEIETGTADVGNPAPVTSLSAIPYENEIQITWVPPAADGLRNSIKRYDVELSKDRGSSWVPIGQTQSSSFTYCFVRNTDGWPESSVLASWKFRVRARNIYGKSSLRGRKLNAQGNPALSEKLYQPMQDMPVQRQNLPYQKHSSARYLRVQTP